jgi:hypothetical protein
VAARIPTGGEGYLHETDALPRESMPAKHASRKRRRLPAKHAKGREKRTRKI